MKLFRLPRTKVNDENPVGCKLYAPAFPSRHVESTELCDGEQLDWVLKEFAFVGDNQPGHDGIEIIGPAEFVRVLHGSIYYCDYGIRGVTDWSTFRESVFFDVFIQSCRVGIYLDQPMKSGDGINNVTFRDCEVVYPHESAFVLKNSNPKEHVRRVRVLGGLWHSRRQGTPVPRPLFHLEGNLREITIDADITGGDQTPTILIQGNEAGFPKFTKLRGSIYDGEIWCCETAYRTLDCKMLMQRSNIRVIPDFNVNGPAKPQEDET